MRRLTNRFSFTAYIAHAGWALLLVCIVSACSDSDVPVELDYVPVSADVSPREVKAFGHELIRVEADRSLFRESSVVTIHGHAIYDYTVESPRIATFRWQGAPDEQVAIDVETGGTTYRIENALAVSQPAHPAFERMVSLGASFGQGVISQSFDLDSQIHAPSAQLARAAGAYFPLPLTKRGYIPSIDPEDFDEQCREVGYEPKMEDSIGRILEVFSTPEGRMQPWALRKDPHLQTRNAAVGGSVLGGIVHGALNQGEQEAIMFLEHFVYDPFVDWTGFFQRPGPGSQLDYVASLNPTMAMLVDTIGNDVLPGLGGGFDVDRIAGDEYFREHYSELFARLGKDTWVFIADTPDITTLPRVKSRRTARLEAGEPAEEVDARIAAIKVRINEINDILAEVTADYPRAVIVPFSKLVDDMTDGAMVFGGQEYSFANFGGFISLDHLHLTRTGYAVLADLFVEHMNLHLGTDIPAIDVDAIALADPLSPAKLAEHGLSPEACPGN